jgi:molybdenum cofactor synthesis domain-containing protein
VLQAHVKVSPREELVPLGRSFGRVLSRDVFSKFDVPLRDSSHMDGYAVRASDLSGASAAAPVTLARVEGSALGELPRRRLKAGEAHSVLTGGFIPDGADSVVQAERVQASKASVSFSVPVELGEYVYPRGRDVKKGEKVLAKGRVLRGPDLVLLGSLHLGEVTVFARPRVAVLPTGSELSEKISDTEPGKVAETHTLLLSRLIEGAGGTPVQMPIARDDREEIEQSIRVALKAAEIVITLAGTSVSEADLTEEAINAAGKPGVLVHGMRVTRGRVMGFGAVGGKAVVILPGPIQGAVNAFNLLVYPLIRSFLGLGFSAPPSFPARMGNDWEAAKRFRDFTKIVFVRLDATGEHIAVEGSMGETENVSFLSQSDGYLVLGEETTSLSRGDLVRVYLPVGLCP